MTALSIWWRGQSRSWICQIILNAGSLVGTTVVTSLFGFLYWGAATHYFPPADIGFGSAIISAMNLLGALGALGLGTILIAELPRQRSQRTPLIGTALLISCLAGTALGGLFAALSPVFFPTFAELASSPISIALFAVGGGLTTAALVADSALLGLLRGDLQLGRNTLFAIAKLVALFALVTTFTVRGGLVIYATWVLGTLLSMLALLGLGLYCRVPLTGWWPRWELIRALGRAAPSHHALNLALQVPDRLMPMLVAIMLSTTANAFFYTAWMVAGAVFAGVAALTMALFASGAQNSAALARQLRFTLGLGGGAVIVAYAATLLGSSYFLRFFGEAYAEQADIYLKILALGAFPLLVKDHYIAICRLNGRAGQVALFVAAGSCLELGLVAVGALHSGLIGVCVAWVLAVCLEALLMFGTVYRAARPGRFVDLTVEQGIVA